MPRHREHSRGSSASPESLSRDVEQPVYVCKDCRGTNYPPTVFRSKCHRVFPVEWWGSHSSRTRHSQQGLLGGRYFPSPSAATTLRQRRGEKGGNLRGYIVPSSNPRPNSLFRCLPGVLPPPRVSSGYNFLPNPIVRVSVQLWRVAPRCWYVVPSVSLLPGACLSTVAQFFQGTVFPRKMDEQLKRESGSGFHTKVHPRRYDYLPEE